MKFLPILILALLPLAALADTTSTANSMSYAQTSSQAQATAAVGVGVNASGGNTTVSQDHDDPAPAIAPPAVQTSAPCFVGYSGGVSVAGFGASAGGGIEDRKCTVRETSRILHGQGEIEASVRVMCVDGLAALALGPRKCAGMPILFPIEACHNDEVVAARLGLPACRE